MHIYLLKDVEKVGMKGSVVKVAEGFAENFLIPRKLGIKVSENELAFYQNKKVKEQVTSEVINSKVAMLAERIKGLHLTVKERAHDDGKLYGSVGADELVELLKKNDIQVNRKQVEFDKAIRKVGDHKVTIKLSTKLKPQLTLKVLASEVK
ncbi:MAG: 50S ribosomal protein L9 [Candidatus Babeliales bacterium]